MSRPGYIRVPNDLGGSERAVELAEVATLEAVGLYILVLCYCDRQRTDGLVPRRAVSRVVAPGLDCERPLAELERVGFLEPTTEGWQVVDYLDWQRSREQIEGASESARHAARSRWGTADGNAERTADGNAERTADGNAPNQPTNQPTNKPTNSGLVPAADAADEECSEEDEGTRRAKAPKLSAASDQDWERRAAELLEASQFPSDLLQLAEIMADGNKTRKVSTSRVVRELYEPLVAAESEFSPAAMRYGLRAAITAAGGRGAANATYVKKAAAGWRGNGSAAAASARPSLPLPAELTNKQRFVITYLREGYFNPALGEPDEVAAWRELALNGVTEAEVLAW